MTTVTLNTDESLLAEACEILAQRNSSLEEAWNQKLREITDGEKRGRRFDEMMRSLQHVNLGGPYTRDEMNER